MTTKMGAARGALTAFACSCALAAGCSDGTAGDDAGVGGGSGGGVMDSGPEGTPTGVDGNGASATRVEIDDGTIEGALAGGTLRFLGIPYATPPVGELRWRPPGPVEPWEGTLDATAPRPGCVQLGAGINPVPDTSEDCLYLNVWTPDVDPEALLPVMVWLHGGGNASGSAVELAQIDNEQLAYTGQYLIEAAPPPVVVVTLNYRLNRFGYLAHSGLTAEEGTSGNYGLMDQQAALRWVRDNISQFGGDPGQVTLFGQSAGALDTCLQLMAPGSRGLFARAILESAGVCLPDRGWRDLEETEMGGELFAEHVGCTGADDAEVVACLRGLTTEEVMQRGPPSDDRLPGGVLYQGSDPMWFVPIIDGVILPKPVAAIVAKGENAKIPTIIGNNDREGDLFHGPILGGIPPANDIEYRDALGRFFGEEVADAIAAQYPASDFPSPNDALAEVTGDGLFICPGQNLARALTTQGNEVFRYNYKHALGFSPLGNLGPTHGAEVALVWGWADVDAIADLVTDADRVVGSAMVGYWTRFAATGDPNGDGAPEWPAFDVETESELVFDDPVHTTPSSRSEACDFWATVH